MALIDKSFLRHYGEPLFEYYGENGTISISGEDYNVTFAIGQYSDNNIILIAKISLKKGQRMRMG